MKKAKKSIPAPTLPEAIVIQVEETRKRVATEDYIKAKTKQLREFGYDNLTVEEVREQVGKVLTKEKKLTVIGGFIKIDIVLE